MAAMAEKDITSQSSRWKFHLSSFCEILFGYTIEIEPGERWVRHCACDSFVRPFLLARVHHFCKRVCQNILRPQATQRTAELSIRRVLFLWVLLLHWCVSAQYFPKFCLKKFTGILGGIWTHHLCQSRAVSYQPDDRDCQEQKAVWILYSSSASHNNFIDAKFTWTGLDLDTSPAFNH